MYGTIDPQPQNDEYQGKPYHEKKFHKTHFSMDWDKSWKSGEEREWVRVAPGRYKLKPKETPDGGA